MEFGLLEEVEVRHLWKHEQYDFSNWLARPESIERLNDVLGLTLTDVKKEVFVGATAATLLQKMKQREQRSSLKISWKRPITTIWEKSLLTLPGWTPR